MRYHFGSLYFENCCVNFMDRIENQPTFFGNWCTFKKNKKQKKNPVLWPNISTSKLWCTELCSHLVGGGGGTWWGPEASGQCDPLLGYSLSCSGTCSDFRYYCKSNSWVKFICGTPDLEWNRAFGHATPSPSSIVKGLWRARYRKTSLTKITYFCNYWLLGR